MARKREQELTPPPATHGEANGNGNGFGHRKSELELARERRSQVAEQIAEMEKINEVIREAIRNRENPEDKLEQLGYEPTQIMDIMEPKTGSDGRSYAGYPLNEVSAKKRFLGVIDKQITKLENGNGHTSLLQSEQRGEGPLPG